MTKDSIALSGEIHETIFKRDHAPPPKSSESALTQRIDEIFKESKSKQVPESLVIALLTATFFTTNCSAGSRVLFNYATRDLNLNSEQDVIKAAGIASLMRDVGLKTISFNGIPKSINCLAALRTHLPDIVNRKLRTKSIRSLDKNDVADIVQRGHALFEDIYHPITDRLYERLASNHPDMAAYIVENHYGALLSDHPSEGDNREIVSIVAVACLRGSGGVAPQVMSHVLGLRKASRRSDASWLTTEQGAMWVLATIDKVRETVQQRSSKL